MCRETLKIIRQEGKSLKQKLDKELYLNHAGLKNKTEIAEIYKSFRDLLEPEIFQSISEAHQKADSEDNGLNLISGFLAHSIILSKSPQIEDTILEGEASSRFNIGKTKVNFRKYRSVLLRKSKKEESQDIIKNTKEILSKLNELYLRQYAYKQKDSHDLGFSSYLDQYENLENHDSKLLAELAKELLRDTEYISRELTAWFFTKKMEIKIQDASIYDLYYLLSSFELKDSFPKLSPHSLAQKILDETGIVLPAVIKFDTENRNGHVSGSYFYPLNPGVEMLVSTNTQKNIFDYESFLDTFGHALCYGFTNRDDYFEYTNLRERSFIKIFSALLKSFLYEPAWLKKHFRIDADDDFLKFLNLRRLIEIRILCARVIFETGLYQKQENKSEMFREIMEVATHCKPDGDTYLYDIQPHLNSLDSLKGQILGSKLRKYMLDNYDEQWWREEESSEFLTNIWEQGGRVFSNELLKKCGFEDFNNKELFKTFEETLG